MLRAERSCWDRLKMGLRTGFGIGSVLKLGGSEAEFTKKWNYTLTMGGFYGMQIILLIKLLKRKKDEQRQQALLERWWAWGHVDQ